MYSYFSNFNSFNTIAAFSFYHCLLLFNGDTSAVGIWPTLHGCIAALITTFLVIPVVTKMSEILARKIIHHHPRNFHHRVYSFCFYLSRETSLLLVCFAIFLIWNRGIVYFDDEYDLMYVIWMNSTMAPQKRGHIWCHILADAKFGYAIAGHKGLIMSLVGFDPMHQSNPREQFFG